MCPVVCSAGVSVTRFLSTPVVRSEGFWRGQAQFHVAWNRVEKQMVSRANLLPPRPLFRGASQQLRDSGPRTDVHIPEQDYMRTVL